MTVNPDDAFTWAHGTTDGEDAIAERIRAKLLVRGLAFGKVTKQDKVWSQAISMMASWKAMNVLLSHDKVTDFDLQRLARVNDRVMTELVVAGLWISPWIEVAQDEFPDIHFDQAKVDDFIAEVPDEVERHIRIQSLPLPRPAEMIAFLEAQGYDVQPADADLVMSLALQILARQFLGAVMGQADDSSEPDLWDVLRQIIDRATQPGSVVWVAFVKHFYLTGPDDEQLCRQLQSPLHGRSNPSRPWGGSPFRGICTHQQYLGRIFY